MNELIPLYDTATQSESWFKRLWRGYLPKKMVIVMVCLALVFTIGFIWKIQNTRIKIAYQELSQLDREITREDYSRLEEMGELKKSLEYTMMFMGLFTILLGLNVLAMSDAKTLMR